MKRVLMLASVASMIDQFNMPNIRLLQEMGYEVDVACNFEKGNTCSDEKIEKLKSTLNEIHVRFYQVDFARDITQVFQNIKAFRQVNQILKKNQYTFIHCHSPIGGVAGRVLGKLNKTKVIYTAHGFHFYKGAPLKNWLIYYPVEWICSWMTDVLICINKEDFTLAKKRLHAKQIIHVPGVGVKVNLELISSDRRGELRKSIGVGNKDILLLSVGELSVRKNHAVVIKALKELKRLDLHYAIAGKGELNLFLQDFAKKCGIRERIHFLGFQENVSEWYDAADIFIFPSYQEGLSVALMEAMSHGMPCVVSKIRGNTELISAKGGRLFVSNSEKDCEKAIRETLISDWKQMGIRNRKKIEKFSVERIEKMMKKLYEVKSNI